LQYAFRDRKNRKRNFRSLWISRINAGSRELGIPYSKLVNGMLIKSILINRKILADIAVNDKKIFKKIVDKAVS
jgi:large subunit ribosomal protein L20